MMTARVHFLNDEGAETTKDDGRSHPCIRVRYAFAPAPFIGQSTAGMSAPIPAWAGIGRPGPGCEIRADRIPAGIHADRIGESRSYSLAIQFLDAEGGDHIAPAHASVMSAEPRPPFDLRIGTAFFLDAHRWEDRNGVTWLAFRLPPHTYLDFV